LKIKIRKFILLITCLCAINHICAQSNDYPYNYPDYSFLKLDKNVLVFGEKHQKFNHLFSKVDSLLYNGKGSINIVHIGASHVQADQYSGRFREKLYHLVPGLVSDRGILFPYSMAKTNHPYNYYSKYTGKWVACRNVEYSKTCNMGVSGISAFTEDSIAEFNIYLKKSIYPTFYFNKITVLHATGECYYDIELITDDSTLCVKNECEGYTVFETGKFLDTLSFRIIKNDSLQTSFELYGVLAGIDSAEGITYNAIGVNGATVSAYLRCALFKEHLTLLKPDLVILSLGINDVQSNEFSSDVFEKNYENMINKIWEVNPQASIIFTTNSDSYLKRKRPNSNSLVARQVICKLVEKYENTALWDWFDVMGGLGSVKQWERKNLAKKDLVHFTKEGYFLIGDLFYGAFIKSFEDYMNKKD